MCNKLTAESSSISTNNEIQNSWKKFSFFFFEGTYLTAQLPVNMYSFDIAELNLNRGKINIKQKQHYTIN